MVLLSEYVRNFQHERNLIYDDMAESTASTEWTAIKSYSDAIIIEYDEQVLVFSIQLSIPSGGAYVRVKAGGRVIFFKEYSAGGSREEAGLAYLPIGTYSLTVEGKVKTAGETLSVNLVKAGVAELSDACGDIASGSASAADNSTVTLISHGVSLPSKRKTVIGETAKTILRIPVYAFSTKEGDAGDTELSGNYADTIYGGEVCGNEVHADAPCAGKKITKAKFVLYRRGSAMGEVYCYVRRADTNELLGCLGSVDASEIPDTGYVWVEFDGGDDIQLPEGVAVRIYLKYPNGNSSHYIYIRYPASQTLSWAHRCWSDDESSWSEDTSHNYRMHVYWSEPAAEPIAFKNPDEADETGKINLRLKVNGVDTDWSERNESAGMGFAEGLSVINLLSEASTIQIELTAANKTGGTRLITAETSLYASPWLLPEELESTITPNIPYNSTLYVTAEPLEKDNPDKTLGIGFSKALKALSESICTSSII